MEASKEESKESAPETLPTEIAEEKPKMTKLLAVIIVVIVVVAAIAAAFGLGLFGGKKEKENLPPTAGARATSPTTINPGETVSFQSIATDPDGTVADFAWYFGDGTMTNGSTLGNVTHTYAYGGNYWVYHVVKDDKGANASNEASMIRVIVIYYDPINVEADTGLANTTRPYAVLSSDKDIIENGTLVTFNATRCFGVGAWSWVNASNHSEGEQWDYNPANASYLTSVKLDFGDGSAVVDVNMTTWTVAHTYTTVGHFAATLNVTGNNSGHILSTVVMRTIHVMQVPPPSTTIKNPDAFIEATIGEPDSLDPAIDYETAGGEVIMNVYEPLIWFDGGSPDKLVPMLAKEVPTLANGLISPDGLNYTFNLKANVKFHNGAVMTADDVVFSFQRAFRIREPSSPYWMLEQCMNGYLTYMWFNKTVSAYSNYLNTSGDSASWIRAVLEPLGWSHLINDTDVKNVAEVVVVKLNDTAVKFRLTHPYPAFNYVMAYTIGDIVNKAWVEDVAHDGPIVAGDKHTYLETHMMGTGPYKFVVWEIGSKIHLTRWDDYWGTKAKLKDYYIIKSNDVNTRILMLQSGDADFIYLPIKYESTVAGKPDLYKITKGLATFDQTFITFNFNIDEVKANADYGTNVTNDFFSDPVSGVHMRRAFSHLFNFSSYIANVAMSNAIQPNGPIPQGVFGYNATVPKQEYNLTMAQQEFQLAINPHTGNSWWADGFNIPLAYNAGNTARKTACEMVKASLEALAPGRMTAEIAVLDWPVYADEVFFNDHAFAAMYVIGWGPDYYDPDDFTTPELHSIAGSYPIYTGYANTTIDTLIEQASKELNATKRAQLYYDMSMGCYNDTPYIWLTQPYNFHVERTWLKGWVYNPMYSTNIYALPLYKA